MADVIEPTIMTWHEKPVRFVRDSIGILIPVVDIARATGVDKRSLLNTLDNNQGVFSRHERDVTLITPGGPQPTRCLDKMGTFGLIFKVSTNHIKNAKVKESLIEFNEWAMERLAESQNKFLALATPAQKLMEPDWVAKTLVHLDFAETFCERTGADLSKARMFALDAASRETGIDLGKYKFIIPGIEPQEEGYLTPTQIAERISKIGPREFSPHDVNKFLENRGYQVRDQDNRWCPTEKGIPLSKFIPIVRGSYSGDQLIWRQEIILIEKMGQ